ESGDGIPHDLLELWPAQCGRYVLRPGKIWDDFRYYARGGTQFLSHDRKFRRAPMGLDGRRAQCFFTVSGGTGIWCCQSEDHCAPREIPVGTGRALHDYKLYGGGPKFYSTRYVQSRECLPVREQCLRKAGRGLEYIKGDRNGEGTVRSCV